jgi:superfamily II DNA/RNA helicase
MANRSHAAARGNKQHRNTNKPKNPRHGSNNAGRGGKKKSKLIDTDLFINNDVKVAQQVDYVATHKFTDFGFDSRVERNVISVGYETPTQIQDESIKPIMEGRDLIGLANTGTGKTAAFLLPIIDKLLRTEGKNDVLIITPTRELAAQIEDDFRAFTKGMKLYSALCVGGTNINPQIKALAKEPHVVIGTPGRLKDLLQQNKLDLDFTDTLVLDEADRMLDMGFIKDVRFLCDAVPAKRQTLCFSATVTPDIQRLLDNLLTNPVKCSVRTNTTNDHIHQSIVHAGDKAEKVEQLHDILIKDDVTKAIVFMRTKWSAQKLSDNLVKRGFKSEAIHGNKSQPQRQRALNAFKSDKVNILVATDVAARGLDIPEVSHVINFDEPETHDDYIHRIGRTGRAGLGGNAVTFVEKRR